MDDNKFAAAVAAATGARTAEQQAASNASIAGMLSQADRIKAEALTDPSHPYHKASSEFWARFTGRPQFTPEQLAAQAANQARVAAEHHAASFVLDDQLHENMQAAINSRLEPLAGDKVARDEATTALKEELGAAGYAALVKDATLYKPLTDSEKADRITLQLYASQGQRNQFKRGTPR